MNAPKINGRCIADHRVSTWTGRVYKITSSDVHEITASSISCMTGFTGIFVEEIPVRYISYFQGSYRIMFEYLGQKHDTWFDEKIGYLKISNYYVIVLNEELKDGVSLVK